MLVVCGEGRGEGGGDIPSLEAAGGAPTKQGSKKRIHKTTIKEAARDANRGLKQTGIASFFGR